jgi:predicted nucleic acid-binding protein
MVIISNATPLIAFAKIGQLALLQKIVTNLVIPKAVADEISTTLKVTGFIDSAETGSRHLYF